MAELRINGGACRCFGCEFDRNTVLDALTGEWGSGNSWARPVPVAPQARGNAERELQRRRGTA